MTIWLYLSVFPFGVVGVGGVGVLNVGRLLSSLVDFAHSNQCCILIHDHNMNFQIFKQRFCYNRNFMHNTSTRDLQMVLL